MKSEEKEHKLPRLGGAPACLPADLDVPGEFYPVLTEPPLAGMRLPLRELPWEGLHGSGFRYVACLCAERPGYDPSPLDFLVKIELCDLVEKELPDDPEFEERAIRAISHAVAVRLKSGEGVVVHCAGGRGRTGTVLGCALRELGYETGEIVSFLDRIHRERGKPGWPESPWQREVVARYEPE
jgi:hypothetical protein